MPVPIVLVHGGAHGAWCWEPTTPYLDGEVLAVDLPPKSIRGGLGRHEALPELRTLTLADFATSALGDIDSAGFERFVLVGHSMGGLTISELARRVPDRIERLVYVSCIVPPEGGSSVDTLPEELRDTTRDAIERARRGDGNPIGEMDEAMLQVMFCNDLDEERTRFVLDHVGTEAVGILGEHVSRVGIPPELPKTFVKLLQDQSLAPDLQDVLIDNLRASPGGDVDVVTIDAAHDVMISRPKELADVLNATTANS
jgi:pimeloyl-ACP methyl ester carboxylesterase